MKRLQIYFLALLIVAIGFSSCGNKNSDAKIIPSTASMIVHFNLQSMGKNVSWSDIKSAHWLEKMGAEDVPAWVRRIADNPDSTGIRFEKGITFFANGDSSNNMYGVMTGIIRDENSFIAFNKNIVAAGSNVEKSDKLNFLQLAEGNLVAWQGDRFIYIFPGSFAADMPMPGSQSSTAKVDAKNICTYLFNLPSKNSVAKNDAFADLMKEDGDIRFWLNAEQLAKISQETGPLGMLNSDIFYKNNYSTFVVNFTDGEIAIHQKQFSSKELSDFYKKYGGKVINLAMIKRIPAENVFGVLALNFQPEAIEQFLKLAGIDGLANMFLQSAGLTLHDFSLANNGNIVFAVAAGDPVPANDSTVSSSEFKAIMAMGVKDDQAAQKLLAAGRKVIPEEAAGSDFALLDNKEMIAISNSNDFATQYLAGKSKNDYSFLSNLKNQPLAGFLDLQRIFTYLKTSGQPNGNDQAMFDINQKMWKSVVVNGGQRDGDAVSIVTQVHLMDEKTNSLRQLYNYASNLYQVEQERKKQNPSVDVDSVLTAPQIDTVGIPGSQDNK